MNLDELPSPARRRFCRGGARIAAAAGLVHAAPAPAAPNEAVLAMVGEPQSLDPMASTADLVGTLMQHVAEPLYTFDGRWNLQPMLAAGPAVISDGGRRYAIALRPGVALHNGRTLTSDDVVASLQRWMATAARGKAVAREVEHLRTQGGLAIEILLKRPYAPLLAQLAVPTGMAAILARETLATPLKAIIGTGPYRVKEHLPDRHLLLSRFEAYSARTEPASGYAGRRQALIEQLRFVPVPHPDVRVDGVLDGDYDYADLLAVNALPRLEATSRRVQPVLTPWFGFPYLVFNLQAGIASKLALRQAVQTAIGPAELLAAAFADKRFYIAEGNHFPIGSVFYSTAGVERYDVHDPKQARTLLAQAGYRGEPLRLLASRQYEFHHTIALTLVEQLRRAGMRVELQTVDWATLMQRRTDPALWDVYVTHSGQFPEPMLSPPQLGDGAPGGWDNAAKRAALAAFNAETDPARRGAMWGPVQQLVYEEVPYIVIGKFNGLSACSPALANYQPATWPFFWNVRKR